MILRKELGLILTTNYTTNRLIIQHPKTGTISPRKGHYQSKAICSKPISCYEINTGACETFTKDTLSIYSEVSIYGESHRCDNTSLSHEKRQDSLRMKWGYPERLASTLCTVFSDWPRRPGHWKVAEYCECWLSRAADNKFDAETRGAWTTWTLTLAAWR